ncbi:MAG: hypothetical protein WBW88_18830 [Rhodothermales bacterium]
MALTVAQVMAQAPDSLSFQGKLTDTGGTPLNATVSMRFKLYKGGTNVWTETQPSVQVTDGVFNVLLGSVTPLDTIAFDQPIDLGIKVGTDDEITPRTPLTASAFSLGMRGMHAERVESFIWRGYNVVGGWKNKVAPGVVGATIAGGGALYKEFGIDTLWSNSVADDFGTIGGGLGNTAGSHATVGGGSNNTADGSDATIAGGYGSEASGTYATVTGGRDNVALGRYSFAAGRRAKANHGGTFVWSSEPSGLDFASTGINQFLIRASGGTGIGTNNPGSHALSVIDSTAGGIDGATLNVENHNTGQAIAAHIRANGTDAALVIGQDGTGDHIRTFDNGNLRFRVYDNGNVTADGTFTGGGADMAEAVGVEGTKEKYEAGDVLVVSQSEDRTMSLSRKPYSDLVAGVYATKPGVVMTNRGISEDFSDRIPLGVVGIIPTKVTAENGPIRRGDLLVTSSTPGHAMRADRSRLTFGVVLGKALGPFDGPGEGVIEVLVMPR